MENPSLRVTGHVSTMNRTFIAEDYAEDDFGQWAKDEVTGEQGYVDDERSCFWTWDDTECVWQSRPYKGRQLKRKKGKGKGKHKRKPKRSGKSIPGRRTSTRFRNVVRRGLCWGPDKGAGKDYTQNKGKGKYQKGKSKEEAHPQSGLSPSEAPEEEGKKPCLGT